MDVYSNIEKKAATMAANAKNSTLKFNGKIFTFKYNGYQSYYEVFNEDNEIIIRFNTKKITEAKQLFKQNYAE